MPSILGVQFQLPTFSKVFRDQHLSPRSPFNFHNNSNLKEIPMSFEGFELYTSPHPLDH
jgi:hypothetical protein